jgi:hypothetical protein
MTNARPQRLRLRCLVRADCSLSANVFERNSSLQVSGNRLGDQQAEPEKGALLLVSDNVDFFVTTLCLYLRDNFPFCHLLVRTKRLWYVYALVITHLLMVGCGMRSLRQCIVTFNPIVMICCRYRYIFDARVDSSLLRTSRPCHQPKRDMQSNRCCD